MEKQHDQIIPEQNKSRTKENACSQADDILDPDRITDAFLISASIVLCCKNPCPG
jgi:hypothetical protein